MWPMTFIDARWQIEVAPAPEFAETTCEGLRFGKAGEIAEEPQLAGRDRIVRQPVLFSVVPQSARASPFVST